jgi:tetratricopeptide (TPR) repeat protein
MIVPALFLWYFGGWPLFGLAGIAMLAPMAGYGSNILQLKKAPPIYARAIARMKFGKYSEAEMEIIQELEKCEDDFDGWLMLAGLYANQFNDLAEAEKTILEICAHPKTTPSQLSIALHQLANWHLQRGGNPAAARRALQMICTRLPGTHLAHMAQLRINQLPASVKELRQQQSGAPIPLPALGDSIDQAPPTESGMQRHEAAEAANACVETLSRDPNNTSARERLARLFAEHLDQPDLGIEQANLLLDLPDQPESRRAEWLSLIAAWHIRYRHDTDAARETLQRLIRDFPQTPQALAARRRLQLLSAETGSRATGQ